MKNRWSFLFLIVIGMTWPAALHAATCTPDFPLEPGKPLGWQGADDAYSIPLPGGRDVWIFGDTLYGPKRVVEGHTPRMVHNSIGISTCSDGQWSLKYFIKRDASGNAGNFFTPANPEYWYWAMDGFVAHNDLWVTLLCIRPASHPEPWAMDFETCGSDLARISNPEADPDRWKIQYFPLVPDGVGAYPSASAVVEGKYVYLFALYEAGSRPLLATRIPLSGLDNPQKHLEYLAANGEWKPGLDPGQARHVMEKGATELTIRYHADYDQWFAVLFEPEGFSDKVILRTAPELTGPWTEGTTIYHVPEMLPGAQHNEHVFCYAGKEHPEFEKKGQIVLTYACNTMDVPQLQERTDIYFPKVVTVPIPKEIKKAADKKSQRPR